MYGKKVCFDYPGVKKQFTNCYGPHAKRYCRSERVGMENFVKGFSQMYNFIPSGLYGKLSGLAVNIVTKPPPANTHANQRVRHTTDMLPNVTATQNAARLCSNERTK